MKKLMLYAALFAALDCSMLLKGGLAEDIGDWLTQADSGSYADHQAMCQNIGKKGRFLSALPSKTKKIILNKCEFELLGLDRHENNTGIMYGDIYKKSYFHPQAWWAVLAEKPGGGIDWEAQMRFEKLKKIKPAVATSEMASPEQRIACAPQKLQLMPTTPEKRAFVQQCRLYGL